MNDQLFCKNEACYYSEEFPQPRINIHGECVTHVCTRLAVRLKMCTDKAPCVMVCNDFKPMEE